MLDRRHEQPVARLLRPPVSMAGVSASTLASVPPQVKVTFLRLGPDQRGDLLARLLDQAARRAALGMDRGRIAGQRKRGAHGGARLRPQRRGRVPVEIALGQPSLCASIQLTVFWP